MPAVSQAQRDFLFAKFGAAWMKKHGFDNKGPLPSHISDTKKGATVAATRSGLPRPAADYKSKGGKEPVGYEASPASEVKKKPGVEPGDNENNESMPDAEGKAAKVKIGKKMLRKGK